VIGLPVEKPLADFFPQFCEVGIDALQTAREVRGVAFGEDDQAFAVALTDAVCEA
jgi:hypothetical protein